jgi:hypothetical protein
VTRAHRPQPVRKLQGRVHYVVCADSKVMALSDSLPHARRIAELFPEGLVLVKRGALPPELHGAVRRLHAQIDGQSAPTGPASRPSGELLAEPHGPPSSLLPRPRFDRRPVLRVLRGGRS